MFEIHLSDSHRFRLRYFRAFHCSTDCSFVWQHHIFSLCVLIIRRSAALFKNTTHNENAHSIWIPFCTAAVFFSFMDKISFCLSPNSKNETNKTFHNIYGPFTDTPRLLVDSCQLKACWLHCFRLAFVCPMRSLHLYLITTL